MAKPDPLIAELKARRLHLGMTLQQVEDRSGCRFQQVWLWESCGAYPRLNNLRRWCDALGLKPALLSRSDEEGAPDGE